MSLVERRIFLAVLLLLQVRAGAQTLVEDIFGRALNQHGITLVDWDGYIANPLIKFYLRPPTNGILPGSATLTANGARLYFDTPGNVGSQGPSKTVALANASAKTPVRLSIFPDRDGLDEDYLLTIVFTGANSARQTNTVPIHVIDQDLTRANDFNVIENFDRDVTGFFTNATGRALVKQAADDWSYFFAGLNLDSVPAGAERTYIWSNNFNGGYSFTSTNAYTGFLLYAYGTINNAHRSGGEASYESPVQSAGGMPLPIKRSGGFEAEIYGNYNTLGWLMLPKENDWLATGNLGNETNDFFSIAHHEIGHALIFNHAHPGFNAAWTSGAFRSSTVTNYFGAKVPIDASEHLNGSIDPESGQGAFGYEYYGSIPRKRWLITKLDLLCAQEAGHQLRPSSAFASLLFPGQTLPRAAVTMPFVFFFTASGGIPFYHWDAPDGQLPPGLALDPFSGAIEGIPATNGAFTFTIRVRDYREAGPGATQTFTLDVSSPPIPRFDFPLIRERTTSQLDLRVFGATGQRQIVQVSSNLINWIPFLTNVFASDLFEFTVGIPGQPSSCFYRSLISP